MNNQTTTNAILLIFLGIMVYETGKWLGGKLFDFCERTFFKLKVWYKVRKLKHETIDTK